MDQDPTGRREGFHPCLCFNLRQAARRVSAFYDAHLAKTGLSSTQLALLAEIASRDTTPIGGLAERLDLDPSTLSRTLRPLESGRLIEFVDDEKNRRLRLVTITPEGRGRLRDGLEAWRKAQAGDASAIPEGLVQAVVEGAGRLPALPHAEKPI